MRGFTLLELIVVLALLGLIVGVSAVALGSLRIPKETTVGTRLREGRVRAIQNGAPHFVEGVLFLPDGRAIGPGVDPLTGTPDAK